MAAKNLENDFDLAVEVTGIWDLETCLHYLDCLLSLLLLYFLLISILDPLLSLSPPSPSAP